MLEAKLTRAGPSRGPDERSVQTDVRERITFQGRKRIRQSNRVFKNYTVRARRKPNPCCPPFHSSPRRLRQDKTAPVRSVGKEDADDRSFGARKLLQRCATDEKNQNQNRSDDGDLSARPLLIVRERGVRTQKTWDGNVPG